MNSNVETSGSSGNRPRFTINVDGREHEVDDPVLTGRQVLNLAGKSPAEEHLLYLLEKDNVLEDIGLEETVDLRGAGVERFMVFRADRSFRFELNGKRQDWGAPKISEETLRELAGVDQCFRVFLERQNESDRLIERGEFVDLTTPGVEHIYTKQVFAVTVVNEDDGREVKLDADPTTGIETLIARMYTTFGVARQGDDRLRCERDGSDVFSHAGQTIGEYLAVLCGCIVWLFAGGTGGASCR
jgi:hypothetical protein